MQPADLVEAVIVTTQKLVSESVHFETDGESILAAIDEPVEKSDLYHAMKEAYRRGAIDCYWQGGMELPVMVKLPV
jgi:hypothetical protein